MMVRTILKMVMLSAMAFGLNIGVASAAIIGSMGLTGIYSTSGGTDQSNDTTLILNTLITGTDEFDNGLGVTFGETGTVNVSNFLFSPESSFIPVSNVFVIEGLHLDLTSLTIVDQLADILTLTGNGVLSNGSESTAATWEFSGNVVGTSYSMTVTAVPVPAAVWLFGSGLIGLIGVTRRKA